MSRVSSYAIDPQFLERWSPRAMDGRALEEAELKTVLEAARWAPSAYNYQPWHFLYALRDDKHWAAFLGMLAPVNQSWAKNAGALLFIVSNTVMAIEGNETLSHSHSFDAGAAWMSLALQCSHSGLCAHAMQGIDFDAVRQGLNIPESFRIECAVAIGHRASPDILPDALRQREQPNDRKPLEQIITAGPFP